MREEIGIFVNPSARENHKRAAVALARRLPNSLLSEMTFPLAIPENIQTTIVFGGDGSVTTTTEELLKRENPGQLLIVPAGSQNGLYSALTDVKSTITVEELQDNVLETIPQFTPGVINTHLFNHLADITKAGVLQVQYAEALRKYSPRKLRAYASVVIGFAVITKGEDYPLYGFDMLMTSPYIGSTKSFPNQGLYDDTLTLISLRAQTKLEGARKMAVLFLYMGMKKPVPKTIAEITTKKSFTLNTHGNAMNVDGELKPLPENGTVFVARHSQSLPIAALSL